MTQQELLDAAKQPTRAGYVWLFKVWPGGRKELTQALPTMEMSVEEAVTRLINPKFPGAGYVRPERATELMLALRKARWRPSSNSCAGGTTWTRR